MKKFLAIFLSVLLTFLSVSTVSFAENADSSTPQPTIQELGDILKRDYGILDYFGDPDLKYLGEIGEYGFYYNNNGPMDPLGCNKTFGSYVFQTENAQHGSDFGLYLISSEKAYSLEDAYKDGIITDMDAVYKMILNSTYNFEFTVRMISQDVAKEDMAKLILEAHFKGYEFSPEYLGTSGDIDVYYDITPGTTTHFCRYDLNSYVFETSTLSYPAVFGIYLIKGTKAYTLEEAFFEKRGIVGSDIFGDVYNMVKNSDREFIFTVTDRRRPTPSVPVTEPITQPVTQPSIEETQPSTELTPEIVTHNLGVVRKIKAGEKVKPFVITNQKNQKVTYTSQNPKIATVDSKGTVTGLKKGTATIVVTVGNEKFISKINVTTDPMFVNYKNQKITSISLHKGTTLKLRLTGKVKGINNVYTNTKVAKITSKKNATKITVKGLKDGLTTLKIKVNGTKTIKLKVDVYSCPMPPKRKK